MSSNTEVVCISYNLTLSFPWPPCCSPPLELSCNFIYILTFQKVEPSVVTVWQSGLLIERSRAAFSSVSVRVAFSFWNSHAILYFFRFFLRKASPPPPDHILLFYLQTLTRSCFSLFVLVSSCWRSRCGNIRREIRLLMRLPIGMDGFIDPEVLTIFFFFIVYSC